VVAVGVVVVVELIVQGGEKEVDKWK
jgi:hypothetical protein